MNQLVTLRLAVPARQGEALRRHPLLRHAPRQKATRETLIFYDTPRRHLSRSGLRLSLRRSGAGWTQVLTAHPEVWPGLSRANVWQVPYGGRFDFSAIEEASIGGLLTRPKVAERLSAVCECAFHRTAWHLDPAPGVRILAKLDRGWIAAAGRREPVLEMMLELEQGAPPDLYDVALAFADRIALVPETLSKAARGERLAEGVAPSPVKASTVDLDPHGGVLAAFRAIALSCLCQLHDNRDGAIHGHDPEYVHQMRVALRRLRAAVRLFKPVLPAECLATIAPAMRELMGELGRTRDLDVLISEIIAPVASALPGEPRLSALESMVTERRFQARRAAVALLERPAYACLQLRVGRLLHAAPFVAPASDDGTALTAPEALHVFAEHRLRRLLKAARALAAHASVDDPVSLHDLRIGIKRLRYAIEFFGDLAPAGSCERIVRRLAKLQDELGQLNDLANAGQILMACAGIDTALREAVTLIAGWHGARHSALLGAIPQRLKVVRGLRLPPFAASPLR